MKLCPRAVLLASFLPFCVVVTAAQEFAPVQVAPTEIHLELSSKEAQTTGGKHWSKIMVVDAWNNDLCITDVRTSPNVIAMVYDLIYHRLGGTQTHMFRVEARLKPTGKVGLLNEWVRLSTNHPDFATIEIPITYRIEGSVRGVPRTLVLAASPDSSAPRRIRLTASAQAGLDVESVTVTDSWLRVESDRIDPHTIDLAVSLEQSPVRTIRRSTISVRTARPETTEIVIPVVALPQATSDHPEILSILAESVRLNRELLRSFDGQWTMTRQRPNRATTREIHRYAFCGDREYRHRMEQDVAPDGNFRTYVMNGPHARSVSPTGPVWLGSTATLKIGQTPFEAALATGAGVVAHLDELDPKHDKVVSVEDALCDGRKCIAVTVEQHIATSTQETSSNILTMYFSIDDGFMPIRIRSVLPEDSGGKKAICDAVVTRFLRYPVCGGTFYVPAEFRHEISGRRYHSMEWRADPNSIRINPDLPDSLFRIEVCPRDGVLDQDLVVGELSIPATSKDFFGAKASFTGMTGQSMEVKTIFGQEFARIWHGSLIGRPLPALEDLQLELDGENVMDQPVLVCFWDINQRPSRHAMESLASQVESLMQRKVVMAAIQVGEVEADVLREWIGERNISSAIGALTDDAERVLSDWAVNSLPWLVLADHRHVVRAEGFDADELANALEAISSP